MRHHVDPGGDHGLDTGRILGMREHRLALRVRDIDRGLGNGRVHVDDRLVFPLVGAGEQFDAVEADLQVVPRHLRRPLRRRSLGKSRVRRQ